MPSITDIQQSLTDRLEELKPLVDEYARVSEALSAITSAPTRNGSPAPRRAHNGVRSGRAQEALNIIKAMPGVKVAEMATQMGVKSSGLYHHVNGLIDEGVVRKDGSGYYPAP